MRIVLITQDDPFYLAENIDFLLERLPQGVDVSACILLPVSPFGKKETLFKKSIKTLSVFGYMFFLRYGFKYLFRKIIANKNINTVLKKRKIPIITLTSSINSEKSLEEIDGFKPDLLVSIAGNEIFRRPLLDLSTYGCLNLHSALLPKYRGLMPSFWVLKNQEVKTGVSVFFVDEGIDSGPIFVQKEIVIDGHSQQELIRESKALGMVAILEAIRKIQLGDLSCTDNLDSEMTYFRFPESTDVAGFLKSGGRFF